MIPGRDSETQHVFTKKLRKQERPTLAVANLGPFRSYGACRPSWRDSRYTECSHAAEVRSSKTVPLKKCFIGRHWPRETHVGLARRACRLRHGASAFAVSEVLRASSTDAPQKSSVASGKRQNASSTHWTCTFPSMPIQNSVKSWPRSVSVARCGVLHFDTH